MLDAIAAPQPLHHLDSLGRAPAAFVDRHAAGLVLAREFTADADAEDEMSGAKQTIKRRDHLGDRHRMAQRQQIDAGAESERGIQRREVGEGGQRIADGSRERYVVGRPQDLVTPSRDGLEVLL